MRRVTQRSEFHEQGQIARLSGANSGVRDLSVLGLEVSFVSQPFAEAVDWSFSGDAHKVLVWRGGNARSKEVEFELGRGSRIVPREGNVWVIPAERRSAALARKTACEFAALTLPALMIGDDTLRPVAGRQDPFLLELVERVAEVRDRDDVVARLLRESLADGIRLHIRDQYGERPSARRRASRKFSSSERQRLVEFLHDSLDAEIDIRSLAALVTMSVNTFNRAFTQTFGTTPYQFVLDLRIEQSKSLLATTLMPVTEISHASGFSSPSHFATMFKQRVGVTPTEFRGDAFG